MKRLGLIVIIWINDLNFNTNTQNTFGYSITILNSLQSFSKWSSGFKFEVHFYIIIFLVAISVVKLWIWIQVNVNYKFCFKYLFFSNFYRSLRTSEFQQQCLRWIQNISREFQQQWLYTWILIAIYRKNWLKYGEFRYI